MTTTPGYWMHETSGVLRPAIMAYLTGTEPLTAGQVGALRAYLRQWIVSEAWCGTGIEDLRARIDGLDSRAAIRAWLHDALEEGIDPL